jgi:hypothetical protein
MDAEVSKLWKIDTEPRTEYHRMSESVMVIRPSGLTCSSPIEPIHDYSCRVGLFRYSVPS